MATTNNAVTISGGLTCSILNAPGIGIGAQHANMAYTDGHTASDHYVNVAVGATALNSALTLAGGEYGFVLITNPGPSAVTLLVDGSPDTTVGIIPPGSASAPVVVVIPVGNGVVLNGTVASGTQTVGITTIKTVPNV